MSISSVGGAGNMSQYMATLLARLQQSEAASSATAVSAATSSSPSAASSTDTSNAATGTTDPTLSDQVIGALVMMQAQGGDPSADASAPDATSTGAASAGAGGDPIAQAFASLDSNGDGTISQSELESGIENAGGTAAEADSVYSALGGTDSTGLSQSAFTSAAQSGGPGGVAGAGGHHHHHHHSGSASSSDPASQLLAALDAEDGTDGTATTTTSTATSGSTSTDGTSSTSTSSTSSSADSNLFSAIDSNGDGSVSQNELSSFLTSLQQGQGAQGNAQAATGDQSAMTAFMQMVNQSYAAAMNVGANSAANTMAMTI